jgi:hypothetical protein
MILGITTFTAVHMLLSLIGILSGLVILLGLLTADPMNGWTSTSAGSRWRSSPYRTEA